MAEYHHIKQRDPPEEFKCLEYIEEGEVGNVMFRATLPDQLNDITLSCRGRSVGYLEEGETAVKDEDLVDSVDPFFFDSGYTSAGRTGFQIWAGSRLILETLLYSNTNDNSHIVTVQEKIKNGAKIIELGSGVGLVGICLAAIGAEVILTDLKTLVDNAIHHNIALNATKNESCDRRYPPWMEDIKPLQVGRGWAGAKALDWSRPIEEQLSAKMYNNVDIVVASDCVWLKSMLDSLLDTVASIFTMSLKGHAKPMLLMSFQRRDTKQEGEDTMFTTVDSVVEAMEKRDWLVECISWRPMNMNDGQPSKDVYLFQVMPLAYDSE
jgi:predicted nicotinamide N-methyase